jgi:hypothetical protein
MPPDVVQTEAMLSSAERTASSSRPESIHWDAQCNRSAIISSMR